MRVFVNVCLSLSLSRTCIQLITVQMLFCIFSRVLRGPSVVSFSGVYELFYLTAPVKMPLKLSLSLRCACPPAHEWGGLVTDVYLSF